MPTQVLDYSLSAFKVPGLAGYTPPFGTKKADGAGLTTTEITRNELMPMMKMRSISGAPPIAGDDPPMGVITEDSIAQPIEFDANFAVASGVRLQLADPSYEGQSSKVVGSFASGPAATVVLGIAGTPEEVAVSAGDALMVMAVNGKWKSFKGGGSGEKAVTNVVNGASYNPGTGAGGISWTDPTVPFDHIQVEDTLNPGNPVNVAKGVQRFTPTAGSHNYVLRTIDASGGVLASVEVGVTAYTVVYLANITSILIPQDLPDRVIVSFDNFVTCTSAAGFTIGGLSDSLVFEDQPNGKSVRLKLSSLVFQSGVAYTLSYTGAGTLKQDDNSNVAAWTNRAITNNSTYAAASLISAQIPQTQPNVLVLVMSSAVKSIDISKFTLTGTSAKISSVVSPSASYSASTVELQLDEPVDASETNIRISMTSGGMLDSLNQAVPVFSNQSVTNNSTNVAVGVQSANVPESATNTLKVIMTGAVSIAGGTSGTGTPTGWSLTGASKAISSWAISDGTITFTLSGGILASETITVAYNGSDSTFIAVSNGDRIAAFSRAVTNNSTDTGGVPPGSNPRNLALTLLGREAASAADVTEIINKVHDTIQNGNIGNLVIGDYFGLPSISIAAGSDAGGAFSANLADITGHGRNLDFVIVAKDPYYNKNGNLAHHVVFHSRNVLSAMTSYYQGGHYMNPTDTNAGGYLNSKGRAFVTTQVKAALQAAGIPMNDSSKIISLSRRVANAGSAATAADTITDNVFLLTEYEVFGTNTYSSSTYEGASVEAHFSGYYTDASSRIKYKSDAVAVHWWGASPHASYAYAFCDVYNNGTANTSIAGAELGVAPAFAVG
jgi:hypothetical protein